MHTICSSYMWQHNLAPYSRRITEKLKWEGISGVCWFQLSLLRCGHLEAVPQHVPNGFWISSRRDSRKVSGKPVSLLSHPCAFTVLSGLMVIPPVFQCVPCPVTQHHWKDPSTVFSYLYPLIIFPWLSSVSIWMKPGFLALPHLWIASVPVSKCIFCFII